DVDRSGERCDPAAEAVHQREGQLGPGLLIRRGGDEVRRIGDGAVGPERRRAVGSEERVAVGVAALVEQYLAVVDQVGQAVAVHVNEIDLFIGLAVRDVGDALRGDVRLRALRGGGAGGLADGRYAGDRLGRRGR